MTTTFLEPGGDATFNIAATTAGGFYRNLGGTSPAIVTDFVHGSHVKSIQIATTNVTSYAVSPNATISNTGNRVSFYVYLNSLPVTANSDIVGFEDINDGTVRVSIQVTTAGVLQLWSGRTAGQIGTDGATLLTGVWYRISLAYTITSNTINRFEVFVNGASSISVTNATLGAATALSCFYIGRQRTGGTIDYRISDVYIDDSTALTDPVNIWVTAKRPSANGTTNGFTTQIGSGGSGYGSGHSSQVNERPLSTTNGWSMIGAGSAVTEEYNIESQATGDINITGSSIVDYIGWVCADALVSETAQIIVNNVTNNIALTSTNTMFTQAAGSTSYPAGTGTDIGIITSTTLTTVSLYECGIMVAYIPSSGFTPSVGSMLRMFQ